jgi:transcriptional regulator with XRE-family HTH domain
MSTVHERAHPETGPKISSEGESAMPRNGKKRSSSIGEQIRKLRIERGLTQTELGLKVGVSQRVITYYEVEGVSPSPDLLIKFAEALGVSTDEVLGHSRARRAAALPENLQLWRRVRKIQTLPVHDRKALLKMIDLFAERADKQRKAS